MALTKVTLSMIEIGLACIEDFGAAVGNSAMDNTTAIGAALVYAASENKVLTTRSIGTFAVTGTITIPAGVQFIGRTAGTKPTLSWTGSAGPTNLTTNSAIVLAGDKSALIGWNIDLATQGDFRRTVSMGGFNDQVCENNVITLALTNVNASQSHFTIFCAANSLFYRASICYNDISGTVNSGFDGLQMSFSVDARVVGNYVHDVTRGPNPGPLAGDRFYWGLYASQKCYGLYMAENTVKNTNTSGIRVSNATDGVANDYGRRVINNTVRNVTWIGLSIDELNGAFVSGNSVVTSGYPAAIINCQNTRWLGGYLSDVVTTSPAVSANMPMLDVINGSTNIDISDVNFGTATNALVCIYSDCSTIRINNIVTNVSSPVAILLSTGASVFIDGIVAVAPTATSAGNRISLTGADCTVIGSRIASSATGQIGVRSSGDRCTVSSCRVTGGTNGIWLTSTSTNSLVVGNIVNGSSSTAILNDGTANVLSANIT